MGKLITPASRIWRVGGPILWEFLSQQLALFVALLACAFIATYLLYRYIPGGDRSFPLADVRVPIWHLVWMGGMDRIHDGFGGAGLGLVLLLSMKERHIGADRLDLR
jgi:hypothetical protein